MQVNYAIDIYTEASVLEAAANIGEFFVIVGICKVGTEHLKAIYDTDSAQLRVSKAMLNVEHEAADSNFWGLWGHHEVEFTSQWGWWSNEVALNVEHEATSSNLISWGRQGHCEVHC